MLSLVLALLAATSVHAQPFNITHFTVPHDVPPGQDEVIVECRYDANFTIVSWFKGATEFFRYKPGVTPSTRSFPVIGIGKVDLLSCGPAACILKLGGLTEDASGTYRCDIEHNTPPYLFETRAAYMKVHGHKHRKPLLEGLAEEFGEGDEMQAYCRGAPDSEFRWYINAKELEEMRGLPTLKIKSSKVIFSGLPPTVTVQCAEFRYGKLLGSKEMKARWREAAPNGEIPQEQRNNGSTIKRFSVLTFLLYIFNINL